MPPVIAAAHASAASSAYDGGAPSAASLQAQLQRYEKQLAECVACASADTPQGKSDIQALSARIVRIEQRIAQIDQAGNHTRTASPTAVQPSPAPGGAIDVFA